MELKMSEHEYLTERHILIIKPSLIYRAQESKEARKEIVDLIEKYNRPKIFVDFRNLDIEFTLWSTIERSKQWENVGALRTIKCAALFDELEKSAVLRMNTLFSKGFKVSPFDNYDEVMKWLLE